MHFLVGKGGVADKYASLLAYMRKPEASRIRQYILV
jgi:hypothetical protein